MSNPHWPMFDLRVTTPDLELRHLREVDLDALVRVQPPDAEQDPASYTFDALDPVANRAAVTYQDYWRARAGWRAESWALSFGVFAGGELVGYQGLEGDDFAVLRTVDSSSFLTPGVRGRGWGKQARAGVLGLAFGALGARLAVTSAWSDNHASLGVSRALGYVDNGVTAHRRGESAGEMTHLRLDRDTWLASGWPEQVAVTGVDPCLPYLGLA